MAKIEKEIIIRAPVEKIFSYVSDPTNLPQIWSALIQVTDVNYLPDGTYTLKWIYKMAGMHFQGTGEYSKVVSNNWIVINTTGGIKSKIVWTFRAKDDFTRVIFTVEYAVPIPLIGKLAESIIMKMNEQEAELLMSNLQARFMMNF